LISLFPSLKRIERFNELFQRQVAATDSKNEFILRVLHENFLFAITVHSFLFSNEEHLGLAESDLIIVYDIG